MAINFEAANMAGYNNPQIEVFKAAVTDDGTALMHYPDKTTILATVKRGSIPFLLATSTQGTFLLRLTSIRPSGDSYCVGFGCTLPVANATTILATVEYPEGNSNPSFTLIMVPKGTP